MPHSENIISYGSIRSFCNYCFKLCISDLWPTVLDSPKLQKKRISCCKYKYITWNNNPSGLKRKLNWFSNTWLLFFQPRFRNKWKQTMNMLANWDLCSAPLHHRKHCPPASTHSKMALLSTKEEIRKNLGRRSVSHRIAPISEKHNGEQPKFDSQSHVLPFWDKEDLD